ncbi:MULTISPECIES: hypothetical protein [unclassified Legionella]|uniref:hypothetical protein n=1 Tax=unclassified Legionella TaxID=2622702 RepID=UPI001E52FF40|nr:hypothetical protein [Legionella sp. 31fI33]MCC5013913.1 hypothetical protein [Legionella sp. 31fI33]
MNREAGMVLISTMLMVALLALLVVSQMQTVFLVYKSLNRLVDKHQSFYQLEMIAQKLSSFNSNQLQAACLVTEKNPDEVFTLLKNGKACSLSYEQQSFFYLIEELGFFPCMQTVKEKGIYSTQHWRLTVLAKDERFNFLQLRIARIAPFIRCEKKPLVFIHTGILSWRYLVR